MSPVVPNDDLKAVYRPERGTGSLICAHNPDEMSRLKAGSGRLVGDVAGMWFCSICHPPAKPLVEHGLIEWADGRWTAPIRVMTKRAPEKGQLNLEHEPAKASKPVPSEAKGTSSTEQAASGPVGSASVGNPEVEPVRAAAPASTPSSAPKSQPKKAPRKKAAKKAVPDDRQTLF